MRYITPANLIKNRLRDQDPPQWKIAVLCFRARRGSDSLVGAFKAKPVKQTIFYGQKAFIEDPFVYEADIGAQKIGLLTRCIWGSPQVAILVEELAHLGVKYLIGYGVAGAIGSSLQLGQQVVAKTSLPTDGTSQIYSQEVLNVDPDLMNLVLQTGRDISCDITQVVAATVDAFYQETAELITTYQNQGAQIINLEISAFYAASKTCGVKCIWLGYISDRLTYKWEDWHWNRDQATQLSEKLCQKLVQRISDI